MAEEISQDIQQNISQDNPDETAAVLAFATKLSEGLLPKAPQTQEMGSPSDLNEKNGETIIPEKKEPEMDIKKEMDGMKEEIMKDVKDVIKEELASIKDTIKEALEDGEEE